jgi:hypothetical protein
MAGFWAGGRLGFWVLDLKAEADVWSESAVLDLISNMNSI